MCSWRAALNSARIGLNSPDLAATALAQSPRMRSSRRRATGIAGFTLPHTHGMFDTAPNVPDCKSHCRKRPATAKSGSPGRKPLGRLMTCASLREVRLKRRRQLSKTGHQPGSLLRHQSDSRASRAPSWSFFGRLPLRIPAQDFPIRFCKRFPVSLAMTRSHTITISL